METAARAPTDAVHHEQAPVQPMAVGPTVDTNPTTTNQSQTSPGYLQSARETLASIAGTVQNAVGIDTPASTLHSIADNAKINASMPSSEHSGAKPGERVGGVGSLPGDNKEEGIARLPAERMSVPSREYEGAQPGEKSGGVGSLPGHLSESNVALLPDERGTQAKEDVHSSVRATLHPSEKTDTSHPSTLHSSEKTGTSHPTGTAGALHPSGTTGASHSSEKTDKQDLKAAAAHPIVTAKQARRDSTSSSSSSDAERDPSAPPKQKTKLRHKVAGGMKTAMGKLKKDEHLIAEGEAQRGH